MSKAQFQALPVHATPLKYYVWFLVLPGPLSLSASSTQKPLFPQSTTAVASCLSQSSARMLSLHKQQGADPADCTNWFPWTFRVAQLHLVVAQQDWCASEGPLLFFTLAFLLPGEDCMPCWMHEMHGPGIFNTVKAERASQSVAQEEQIMRGPGYPVPSHYDHSLALQPGTNCLTTLSLTSSLIKWSHFIAGERA